MGMAGNITEEQKRQLTMVKNSSHRLLNLINDILDISKIEAGKIDILPEEFYVDEVVQEVIDAVMPMANKKGLKLLGETSEKIMIFSDKKCVKQVLMNLADNAVKFNDQGNVQQVDMSSTKKHEGTGLGLYLSKKLVTLLGGDIFVLSILLYLYIPSLGPKENSIIVFFSAL